MKTQESLSVVLPVCNGAHQLVERVDKLLEFLPEISTKFELLIVDNGSSDDSEDIAYELAHDFPQLHVTRHADRRSPSELIRTGLQHTRGDVVVIFDEQARIHPHELRQLWALRHEPGLATARSKVQPRDSMVAPAATRSSRIHSARSEPTAGSNLKMIRRDAAEQRPSTHLSRGPRGGVRRVVVN